MISRHERIRNVVHDALTRSHVDTRNLAIESVDGFLVVEGTVPSADEREQAVLLLRECARQGVSLKCDVSVSDVPPGDSLHRT
jgi:osmotically-inducible protein OsmY